MVKLLPRNTSGIYLLTPRVALVWVQYFRLSGSESWNASAICLRSRGVQRSNVQSQQRPDNLPGRSDHANSLSLGQTQIEVEKLDPFTLRTSKDVQGHHALGHVGPFTQKKMPSAACTTRADRQLTQRLHRRMANI